MPMVQEMGSTTVDGYFLLSMLQVNTKYDFGLLADQAARGEIRSKPEPARSEGEFKTTFHFSQDPTVTFTVDLTRGFLPTRMERKYKQGADGTSYVVAPQIRDCSKGRWFPERIVTFMKQFPTQSPCLIKDFKVTELDVDNRPPKEAFTLDLPAGTKILQFDDSFKWFATRQAEKIVPDDLTRIHNLTEKVPLVPQNDTTIVLPRNYTWVWYAVACGTLVVGYIGWRRVITRRRQNVPT